MGGACSRNKVHLINEDTAAKGRTGKYYKNGSSKWLLRSLSSSSSIRQKELGKYPSLMELCIRKVCEVSMFIQLTTFFAFN